MLSSNVLSCKSPYLWCQSYRGSSWSWCSSWRSLNLAWCSHRLCACMGSHGLPASLGSCTCTCFGAKQLGAQWATGILGPEVPLPGSVLHQPLRLLSLTDFHGCEGPLQDLKTSACTNDTSLAGRARC